MASAKRLVRRLSGGAAPRAHVQPRLHPHRETLRSRRLDDLRGTPDAIRAAIDAGKERKVPLSKAQTVAVHVAYWTSWVGDDGVLRLGPDVYRRDAELARLLAGEKPAG